MDTFQTAVLEMGKGWNSTGSERMESNNGSAAFAVDDESDDVFAYLVSFQ